ncbi:MAG: hypothetical protein FJW30_27925 [Acidobacteria bacterium]|nr:hypothetical protein [Acidobacteriota bacterium]
MRPLCFAAVAGLFAQSNPTITGTVIKSGSNCWNGNLFWFHRNPVLSERRFNRSIAPPVRRSALSLAGARSADCAGGSRENLIAASHNQSLGKLLLDNNSAGCMLQLPLKVYW